MEKTISFTLEEAQAVMVALDIAGPILMEKNQEVSQSGTLSEQDEQGVAISQHFLETMVKVRKRLETFEADIS